MAKVNISDEDLLKELFKLADRTNKRLERLEKYTGKETSWSAKILKQKLSNPALNTATKKGRVSKSKKLTPVQVKGTIKAMKGFLNAQTSTVKGIKAKRKATLKTITKTYNLDPAYVRYLEKKIDNPKLKIEDVLTKEEADKFNVFSDERLNQRERDYADYTATVDKAMDSDYYDDLKERREELQRFDSNDALDYMEIGQAIYEDKILSFVSPSDLVAFLSEAQEKDWTRDDFNREFKANFLDDTYESSWEMQAAIDYLYFNQEYMRESIFGRFFD